MSLSDRLTETRPNRPGKPCGMVAVFAALSKKDADALRDALALPVGDPNRLSSQQISGILKSEGHGVHMKTVEIHRKGACRCGSGG